MKDGLVGSPVLIDHMNAELVPKLVQAIIDDNERAKRAKERARAKKKRAWWRPSND
jgi:hypothetical protein